MILSPGASFGSYKVLAAVGSGAMGEVYRARDGRLGRDVALKIMTEEGAANPDRVRRFEQEARAASSLKHPNIVVVYEVGDAPLPGESRPTPYIAMELVEGQALKAMLGGDGMPVRQFLELASQLADGLARAHESGIVHRDLKPSNIMVSSDGQVKILDFGLAKLRTFPGDDSLVGPAVDETLTAPGAVLGTFGYMSPEQASGEAATAASDQFSLGCILYEMSTGRRPFSGASPAETLSATLRDDPLPIAGLNPRVPPPLRWIVERCLAKRPADRYVSTRDLARDLQTFREHSSEANVLVPRADLGSGRRRQILRMAAAALIVLAAAAAVFISRDVRTRPSLEFRRLTFRHGVVWRALFVPNAEAILYTASWDGLPTKSYLTIPESSGADRSLDSEAQLPMAYSQDGSQVLVLLGGSRAAINARGTLAWWPALGGKARPILQDVGWADWFEGSRLLAVVRDAGVERLLDIRGADGKYRNTVFRTTGAISYVHFSPDGRTVAFIHHPSRFDDAGEVRLAESDRTASRALTPRFERCAGLDWNRKTGEIWFTASRATFTGSTLWSVNPGGTLRVIQSLSDFFVLQGVAAAGARCLLLSAASGTALLVKRRDHPVEDLSWLGSSFVTDISPDGKSALFQDGGATEKSIGTWIRPLDGGDAVRLGDGSPGKFSPDGRWVITLTRPPSGPQQLVLVPVEAGVTRQLTFSDANHSEPSFAGPRTLLFVRSRAGTSQVCRIETDGRGDRTLGVDGCDMPTASPSGREFLCRGGQARNSFFVFPVEGGSGRKLYELPGGRAFIYARWNRAGTAIFAVTRDSRFLTINSATGRVLSDEIVSLGGGIGSDSLLTAAFNSDATIQAYSFERFTSGLYLADRL